MRDMTPWNSSDPLVHGFQRSVFAAKFGVDAATLAALTPRQRVVRILEAYDVDDDNAAFDVSFAYDDEEARGFLAAKWDHIARDWPAGVADEHRSIVERFMTAGVLG